MNKLIEWLHSLFRKKPRKIKVIEHEFPPNQGEFDYASTEKRLAAKYAKYRWYNQS